METINYILFGIIFILAIIIFFLFFFRLSIVDTSTLGNITIPIKIIT